MTADKPFIIGIGNIYLETNYLDLNTGGNDQLEVGKEYRASHYETRLGGSVVNFVLQAKQLGAEVGLIGKRGDDEQGAKLDSLLQQAGITTDLITVSPDVQTSVDTGVVFGHSKDNIQLVAGNANQSLSLSDINLTHPVFGDMHAVYLGGFLKQISLYKDYPALLRKLKQMGKRIFLDHGRIPVDLDDEILDILLESLRYVDGYLPNESELLAITGANDIDRALEKSLTLGPKFVAVKLGKSGSRVKSADVDETVTALQVQPVNVVGAGDSFNAAFITYYLKGTPLNSCLAFANATAAWKISHNDYPEENDIIQIK